jgi:hypothetical protein
MALTKIKNTSLEDADLVALAGNDGSNLTGVSVAPSNITGVTSSAAELNYTDGVTSAIQTQLDAKQGGGSYEIADADISKTDVAETRSASIDMADNVLQRPELKDYAETVNAISTTGGAQSIDLSLGNVVTATIATSTTTFSFVNMPATGKGGAFTLILTNGGSQTVNWPGAVDWAAATQPTLTTAGIDVLTFTTVDGGTIWYGIASGLAMA